MSSRPILIIFALLVIGLLVTTVTFFVQDDASAADDVVTTVDGNGVTSSQGQEIAPICRLPLESGEKVAKCATPTYAGLVPATCTLKVDEEPTIGENGAWTLPRSYNYWFDLGIAESVLHLATSEHSEVGAVSPSLLELGAGLGCYTHFWKSTAGFSEVVAFDGASNVAELTGGLVKTHNLATPLNLDRAFDWVVMLEVAEHVPPEFETVLLDNVERHAARGVVLSWALPGQAGHGHVNSATAEYVIAQMEKRGFRFNERASRDMRDGAKLGWFKQTPLVFVRREP